MTSIFLPTAGGGTTERIRLRLDCSSLIDCVSREENRGRIPAGGPGSASSPWIRVLQLSHGHGESDAWAFVLLAVTKRRCCATIAWGSDVDESTAVSVGSDSDSNSAKTIPPLTVCSLEGPNTDAYDETEVENHARLNEEITCASLLLGKNWANSDGDNNEGTFIGATSAGSTMKDVVIALGTTRGRVLAIEYKVTLYPHSAPIIERTFGTSCPFYEPLPLYSHHAQNRQILQPEPGDEDAVSSQDKDPTAEAAKTSEAPSTSGNPDITLPISDQEPHGPSQPPLRHPFEPKGGVTSISPYCRHSTVWVAYGDGTIVKSSLSSFFPSQQRNGKINGRQNGTERNPATKVRVRTTHSFSPDFADSEYDQNGRQIFPFQVVPIPKSHPSLLAPPRLRQPLEPISTGTNTPESSQQDYSSAGMDDDDDDVEFFEAISYSTAPTGKSHSALSAPTMSLHTSEDRLSVNTTWERQQRDLFGGAEPGDHGGGKHGSNTSSDFSYGSLTNSFLGVLGAAVGAVHWGLGSSSKDVHESSANSNPTEFAHDAGDTASLLQPNKSVPAFAPWLHENPVLGLPTELAIYDAPRKILSLSVDPTGDLVGVADNLGRVLLVDLTAKQLVRVWKGVREASVAWVEKTRPGTNAHSISKPLVYIVIHSKQRRVVEAWRVRHGPRVASVSVSRDAQLVQSFDAPEEGGLARCFIFEASKTPSLEAFSIYDAEAVKADASTHTISSNRDGGTGSISDSAAVSGKQVDAMSLQLLQQLLSSETHVPSSQQSILNTFTRIESVSDLIIALDLLAVSSHLETGLNVDGSSFHTLVVDHCKERLESMKQGGDENDGSVEQGRLVSSFDSKIQYHTQIIDAYNVLHNFETGTHDEDEDEQGRDKDTPRSHWAVEAVSWIQTYEAVTGVGIDSQLKKRGSLEAIPFSSFAKACSKVGEKADSYKEQGADKRHRIFLCDSTKDRTALLAHLFRPLLNDIFVFNVVNSIFTKLGIKGEAAQLQQYFGEWFMTVPAYTVAKASLFGLWCPTIRWLQDIIVLSLTGAEEGPSPQHIVLDSLYSFCCKGGDLPRVFLLAAVCREAISVATKQLETKTYGKISSAVAVKPWDELLRRVRVCLLITLRLHGTSFGPVPVSVANVDAGETFSVYEWIARDELFLSHDHREVLSLEDLCRSSFRAFDPSSLVGDSPSRWKMLQRSCRAIGGGGPRRGARSFLSDESQPGPLLLYLGGHNNPMLLAAHRALILGGKWGQKPSSLEILEDSMCALRSLENGDSNFLALAAAIRLELWQTRLRPVFRAYLFGFDDVPELSDDIVAPLCDDKSWVDRLSKIAVEVLDLMVSAPWIAEYDVAKTSSGILDSRPKRFDSDDEDEEDSDDEEENQWPPIQEDIILKGLLRKARVHEKSSVENHKAVIYSAALAGDVASLSACVPSFYEVFLQTSIFVPAPSAPSCSQEQLEFLNRALYDKAVDESGPIIGQFGLDQIEGLGGIWRVDAKVIRTKFLLAMYDVGKDAMIDELVNASSHLFDHSLFVEGGLEICCVRLDSAISTLRRVKEFRPVVSLLDADACLWVKEQADEAADRRGAGQGRKSDEELPPLAATHSLVLRILRLNSGINNPNTAGKAHTMSILSGTLLKAIQPTDE